MWYGTEKLDSRTLGFLALLTAYAYMLLFDYSDEGITYTDYFIIAWMASFFVDESKQHIVSIIRRKWKSYASDWWNRLDWLSMIVYSSGMLLKLWQGPQFRDASKVLLVAAFILLSIRILNLCCMSAILGPKLVMIREMFRDTFSFMIIMTVIMMCYNISFYARLYPNSEFSWQQMEKIIQNGYWMLFGELNLDGDTLSEPDCTFNRTVYESSEYLQRCPTPLGVQLMPYLKAFYGLIAVILLLNLLIAMYREIDLTEVDRITMLQRQLDTNSKKQEKQNDKNDRRNQKLSKIAKSKENEEEFTEDEEDEIVLSSSSSDEDDSESRSMTSDEEFKSKNILEAIHRIYTGNMH
ncbi:TRPM3 [Mytilus coruscus]|uniref:TRPM3 n=1 Tax=Mytilus coruscus TaxID=42192 RepID=A0A6J8A7F0_MYTCO|nr:TRPM3 [Mytilus coruscus]